LYKSATAPPETEVLSEEVMSIIKKIKGMDINDTNKIAQKISKPEIVQIKEEKK